MGVGFAEIRYEFENSPTDSVWECAVLESKYCRAWSGDGLVGWL